MHVGKSALGLQCFTRLYAVSVDKVLRFNSFFPFWLHLQKLQRGMASTAYVQPLVCDKQLHWWSFSFCRLHRRYVQTFPAKRGKCTWPRLETAKAVVYLLRAAAEIDPPIFFF